MTDCFGGVLKITLGVLYSKFNVNFVLKIV